MEKSIIGHFIGDGWIEPIREFCTRYDFKLGVAIITYESLLEKVRYAFEDTIIYPERLLLEGEPLTSQKTAISLDINRSLLEHLAKYDPIIIPMVERAWRILNVNSHQGWRIKYYKIIQTLCRLVEQANSHLIFFSEPPHNVATFLLYKIAEYHDIKTVMLRESKEIVGNLYAMSKFEKGSEIIGYYYSKALKDNVPTQRIILNGKNASALQKLRKSYKEGMPDYAKKYVSKGKTPIFSYELLKKIHARREKRINFPIRLRKRIKDRISAFYWHKRLPKEYNKHTSALDFNKPSIYFGLHYQPEQTTSPLGDIFESQWLALSILSAACPEGWQIIVKENPYQFIRMDVSQGFFRSASFYSELAKLPNVKLASMNYDSFTLIDNSKIIVTITGMVGWEALNRKKPVILFGYATYWGCHGVFPVNDFSGCKKAIETINNGFEIDLSKIELFAKIVEDHSFKGFVHTRNLENNQLDLSTYQKGWLQALSEWYQFSMGKNSI